MNGIAERNAVRVSRRGVLAGAAAVSALAASDVMGQSSSSAKSRTFVFVHGGWHGGWCWRRVAERLRQRGHTVFTPTLTGVGERSHLLDKRIRLETHIRDVVNVIQWEGLSDVVLVGHSYGGCVISGVAEQSAAAIGALVFLDAFVPRNGEAVVDLASPNVRESINAAKARGDAALAPVPAANFRVNEADRAWVDSKCTPHPLLTLMDKIQLTGARERIARKVYIRASGYPSASFDTAYGRARGDTSWRTSEIASGHDAMIDAPDRLVELLLTQA
jgi:pimeloyl-ACP methyl ester carboxylesterase